ncbi:disease resistance protein RPM1-like [Quercus lobata]|nr:disease resistance protein RPM1-like [Quercus lobata]
MVHLPSETSDQPKVSPEAGEAQKKNSLAHKVVGRCGGLPLSILHLGYLFSGMKNVTYEELLKVLDHIDHNQTPWTEIMDFDVKDLPPHLRQFLSYFGLFPKDSETSARRLVALWVAKGLIKPSGIKQEPPDLVARKILEELISLNLVQVVERRPNGKEKTCSFPSALLDLWLRSNASFDQWLAYNTNEYDASSTLSRGSAEKFKMEEKKNVENQRVLNPRNQWTCLEMIPPSIGNLTNLQTLDVKHTYIGILPSSIWKLKKLRHLCMNQIYRSQIKHQPSGSSLQNLQTLRGAFVDKDSLLKDSLRRLTNLRKLALAFQLNLSQQIALAESFLKLNQLKALKLKSIDEMGRPQDLKATFLLGLENLSNLYLFGKLENTSINRLRQSLTDLTLSASGLLDDPMPELETLKKLECLSLYSGSYTGKSMSCSKGGFPQLHVMNLWMLEELEEWNVVEEAMSNCKKLEIRCCNSLNVPTGLGHLKTLSELKLKDMPVKFTAEIEETKEIIWGDIALSPAIIIDDHRQY